MLRRLLLLLALIGLPLAAAAQQGDDQGFIVRQIESALSTEGTSVRITGFSGALSSTATMAMLTVADAEGVWLRAENLRMNWNRAALLARRIDIREISAETITLLRPPLGQDRTPSPEARPFALPELPVSVNIGRIDVGRILLAPAVLGQEAELTLTGNIALSSGAVNTRLAMSRTDGRLGEVSLVAAYSDATRILSLVMKAEEQEDGILATLAGLPGTPALSAQVTGSGPIDDFRATLLLATDGTTRLTGGATLTGTPDGAREFTLDAQGDISALVLPRYRDFFGPRMRIATAGRVTGDGAVDLTSLMVEAQALTLSGQARITPDGWPERIALDGRISRPDGRPVRLPLADGDISLASALLFIDYDLAAGDAWRGTFGITDLALPDLRLPDLALTGGGSIVPRRGDTPGRLVANLAYAATGMTFADPALARAIGPSVTGELRLSRAQDGPFRIGLFTLEGPGIAAQAEGTIAGPEADFLTRASVALRAADAGRFSGLAGRPVGGAADLAIVAAIEPLNGIFDAAVTGTTRDLAVGIPLADALISGDGSISLAAARDEAGTRLTDFRFATPGVSATATADLTSGASRADFAIELPDTTLALPALPGRASLSGTLLRDTAGTLSLDARAIATGLDARIDAAMSGPGADAVITGSVIADVADLSPFSDLAGRRLSGQGEVMVSGQAAADLGSFDVTAFGRTRDLALGVAALDPLLAGQGRLDGRVTRTGPDSLRISDFRLTTDALLATATADLRPDGGAADLDIRLADVAPLLPGLAGPATVAGTATRDASGATLLALDAEAPGTSARIDGTLGPDLSFEGRLSARVPDLAPFGALAGQEIGGGIDITAEGRLTPDLSGIDLRLAGQTDSLRTGLPQLDPLLRGAGTVALDVTGGWPGPLTIRSLSASTPGLSLAGEGTFADGEGIGSLRLDLPDVSLVAPGFSGPARLAATLGRDATGLSKLEAALSGAGTSANLTATIKPPRFGYHTDLRLTAEVSDLSAYSRLAGLPLGGSFAGTVTGTVTPGANAFDLTVAARTANLDPGNPTAAALLRGAGTLGGRFSLGTDSRLLVRGLDIRFPNVSVTGEIGGTRSAGQGRLNARISDLGLIAPGFPGPATLAGTGSFDERGVWRLQGDATGPGGTTARIGGTISPGLRLGLTVTGSAPLGLANSFIDPNRLSGAADFDLRLQGPPALSSVSGTIRLRDAGLGLPGADIALQSLGGTVTLTGGQASLDLSASPDKGGRIAARGTIGLAEPHVAAIDLVGTGIVLRDPALYETSIDAALRLTGPLTGGALIAGTVDIGATELRVPTSPLGFGGNFPTVRHEAPSTPVVETLARARLTTEGTSMDERSRSGSGRFTLDILVRAPSRVFIRGRGLDAEMGGEVTIRGDTSNLVPTGAIRLIRGRLDILQQRFLLSEGSVDLRGGFVPIIRLVAQTTTRTGLNTSIILEGEVTEPKLSVSSIPELPEDEVLAQLLFGRNLSSVTPLQAIQLASAIATLAGRGGGGIVEGFRDRLGLDNFDVTTDDQGNAAVQAGIYLTDQIYTEAILSADETEINLNFDITRDVTLRGSVASDGDNAIGIYFERDY